MVTELSKLYLIDSRFSRKSWEHAFHGGEATHSLGVGGLNPSNDVVLRSEAEAIITKLQDEVDALRAAVKVLRLEYQDIILEE